MSKHYKNGVLISSLCEGQRIQLPFGVPLTVKQVVPGDACYIEGYFDKDTRLQRIFVVSTDCCVELLTKKGGDHK